MKKLIVLLSFALGVAFTTQGQENKEKEFHIDYTQFELDNGLDVILHEDHSSPVVAVTVTYHVGSKNEDPQRTGFAHFFEHLMFEGSKNIDRGEFFEIVQGAGGRNNAFTSFDKTVYYEVFPSNQFELGLWLESERMLHAKVDSQGVETQREVIKEEKKQRYDNQPYGKILPSIFEESFNEHPYRWVPIGEEQYIDSAKISEFREFYETYYVPNNAVLSIAGDIEPKKAKKLVKRYFGDIPRGEKEKRLPQQSEPPQTEETHDTVYDNIQLPAVIQSFHIPEKGTEDFYALDMLTTLLSDGKSSRLYKKLVDEEEKALQVSSSLMDLEDPGLFFLFAIANQGVDAKALEESLNEELKEVRNGTISDKEFQKLRNQVENDFYSGKTEMQDIAVTLAEYHLFYDNPNLINTEIEKYMSVTKEDLKRVANEYLVPENRSVLYYLPESTEQ